MSRGASGASRTKTLRFRGSTGRARPASAATAPGRGTGGVDENAAADARRRRRGAARRCVPAASRSRRPRRSTSVAPASRAAVAQRAKQRVRIEPALAGKPERARRDSFGREPGKARRERRRVEQRDRRALGDLHAVVLLKDRAAFRPRQDQVAAFAQRRIGIRPEARRHRAQEVEPEAGEADVLRRGELLADRGGGERRRGGRESRVALDQRDGAGKALDRLQEIGDRRADTPPRPRSRRRKDSSRIRFLRTLLSALSMGRQKHRPLCHSFAPPSIPGLTRPSAESLFPKACPDAPSP